MYNFHILEIVLGFFLGAMIAVSICSMCTTENKKLVDKGYGYYNPKTTKFTLRECKEWTPIIIKDRK